MNHGHQVVFPGHLFLWLSGESLYICIAAIVGMAASTLERELGEFNETSHQYPKGWQFGIVIIALCLGTFLIAIDNTIIGVALPKITTVFNSLDDVGWYGSAYLLTVTALQPSFSNVYNFFHVKATYIVSIAIFEGQGLVNSSTRFEHK